MLKKYKPIVIVSGEPESTFLEIFIKALKYKNFKSPLILICSLNLIKNEIKRLKFKKKVKLLNVKNLNSTLEGRSVLNDVRKIMVIDFLDNTKVNGLHNGVNLNNFITANREPLEKLFNKEFVDTYRSVAKALTALQDTSFLGAGASVKSVTEMANQAGMFIDIFAGVVIILIYNI